MLEAGSGAHPRPFVGATCSCRIVDDLTDCARRRLSIGRPRGLCARLLSLIGQHLRRCYCTRAATAPPLPFAACNISPSDTVFGSSKKPLKQVSVKTIGRPLVRQLGGTLHYDRTPSHCRPQCHAAVPEVADQSRPSVECILQRRSRAFAPSPRMVTSCDAANCRESFQLVKKPGASSRRTCCLSVVGHQQHA